MNTYTVRLYQNGKYRRLLERVPFFEDARSRAWREMLAISDDSYSITIFDGNTMLTRVWLGDSGQIKETYYA